VPDAPSSKGRVAGDGQGAQTLVVGCGFIGSHVVTELASQNRPPRVLTRSQLPDAVARAITPGDLTLGDAGDADTLDRALAGVRHVIYSAGGLLPADSQADPERDAALTLRPLRAVLRALRGRPATRLTYISSGGTVYGDPDELPVPESAPVHPRGSYGELHLTCEREIERDRTEHGLDARVLRCSTVYGERQQPDRGQGVVPTFLHRVEQGQPIELYGGERTIRDYIYVGDVAKAVVALLDRHEGEPVLNLGSGEGTSLTEVLRLVERQVGREAVVRQHPERDFDVREIVLDTTRLQKLIEFRPTPLVSGIARTHDWLSAQVPERV